jgi:hypothetical protein
MTFSPGSVPGIKKDLLSFCDIPSPFPPIRSIFSSVSGASSGKRIIVLDLDFPRLLIF